MIRITLGIDGMACGMCEAHINEAETYVKKEFFYSEKAECNDPK